VIYQIYPRSFCDANGDGVGDLQGVLGRLDHVASLGVDGIWLSPFYRSPMKDFGYDVSDYYDVDPLFGSLSDFDAVLARAHQMGLKVIIDQVWSHTSERHAWFAESAASRDNPRADWYVWADAKPDGGPPNNWLATFGGSSWTWNSRRRQYYLHNFLPEQPDLNYWNPKVQDAILDVARFWLDRGVDGFRLDVINYLFHDPRLTDNPPMHHARPPATATEFQRHVHDVSQPQTLAFVERLRALTDQYPGRMTVGEIFDADMTGRQQEYTAGAGRLHTAYSFVFLHARKATPALFAEAMTAWSDASGWPAWCLGNHDAERFPTRLGAGEPRQAQTLLAALLALRGTIFLYQGEELALPQADVPFERLMDPFAIAAWTGGAGRDGARTPMPWTEEEPSAGFSDSAETWLPIDPAHRLLAVARQERDPAATLHLVRRLIRLRRASAALRLGDLRVLDAPAGVLALERQIKGERMLCLFELDGESARRPVPAKASVRLSLHGAEVRDGLATLPPHGALFLDLPAAAGVD
jgi:alpha-glucosidase